MSYDEDPLDLLEDDDDGVIETILFFDEEEEKPILERTGCSILLLSIGTSVSIGWWMISNYLT